jgi:hypothetical protein
MAAITIKKIDKRLFYLLMAIACQAGDKANAALSTMLRGLFYVETAYAPCSNQVSYVPDA